MAYTVIASELVDSGFRYNDAGGTERIEESVPHVYYQENGKFFRFELDLYKIFHASKNDAERAKQRRQWVKPGKAFEVVQYADGEPKGIEWV